MEFPAYTARSIADIIQGEILQAGSCQNRIKYLLTDSRQLVSAPNTLFFALKGRQNDGHKYVKELYQKGCRNFVVEDFTIDFPQLNDATFLQCKDPLLALQKLTSAHRKRFDYPVIGITGSNGKTIVKEWLFQLCNLDKKVIRSPKSYNSQVGVPLSVWQMDPGHNLAIFEAGISEPDEMDKLQKIIQPNIGLFTNIGPAHDKNFIHSNQKIGEKLKLFTRTDLLIYCSDHSEIQEKIHISELDKSINTFCWSRKGPADLMITSIKKADQVTSIEGRAKEHENSIQIPFTDDASIENAIHCWAVMIVLGYEHRDIEARMKMLVPVAMRLEMKEGINGCSIINDSYNSDINSLSIALDFLNQQKQQKEKLVILSDIFQSRRTDEELYTEVSRLLTEKGVNKLIGIGPSVSGQSDLFNIDKTFFPDTASFLEQMNTGNFRDQTILIKGSRIFRFEQISQALQQKAHETVLEINLNALVHNFKYIQSNLKEETRIMGMVKAFSYGSGSFEIANVLQFHHIDYLAVAYADEGVELRKAGIRTPIMVMNPEKSSFDIIIRYSLEPEIYNFRVLELLEEAIKRNGISREKPVPVHIKLDTGMHRLGFIPEEIETLASRFNENKAILPRSIFSHLASSDNSEEDDFTRTQIKTLNTYGNIFREKTGNQDILLHILNSDGIARFPEGQFDMVRLGISLYGISSVHSVQENLMHTGKLKTVISQLKSVNKGETIGYGRSQTASENTRIATVPIGYADGLNRLLSNGQGRLWVKGKAAPIIGKICMDMCMIDISGIDAKEGDEVIVFSPEHPITEIAKELNTIPYEILTSISQRVKRVYLYE